MNNKKLEDFENVDSREEFLLFMKALIRSFHKERETWENQTLSDYLRSIESWVEDLDGFYLNEAIPDIDWEFLAAVLYAGSSYE